MNDTITFLKKELLESVRTYKLFILLAVFSMLGLMNPLFAKLTPQIVALAMPEGMNITVAAPTAIDSWTQFYKNVGQIGIIVILLVFSGILSQELSRGTLVIMLTKGLHRSSVLLAKFIYMLLFWTAGLVLSFLITWGYTVYLFPGDAAHSLFFAAFCLWLFGVFLLSALLFGSAVSGSTYGCMLITAGVFIACMLLNVIPALHKFNPASLASDNMALIQNTLERSELYWTLGITGVLTFGFLTLSVLAFRKKQI